MKTKQVATDKPILSIAIPTYNRIALLAELIIRLKNQINNKYENLIEIVITNDASTDKTVEVVAQISKNAPYIKLINNTKNIGLEKNLIQSAKNCSGKYLWIFGDDDRLNPGALNEIIPHLLEEKYNFLLLNRARANSDFSKILSSNWMNIDNKVNIIYNGVTAICRRWGIISVIGFVTANIFLRENFLVEENELYYGTMYPQLPMMIAAFDNSPAILLGEPLFTQRTQTQHEKAVEHQKLNEINFMTEEITKRDAIYFSFKFIEILNLLVKNKHLSYTDINDITEHTVFNGALKNFIFNNIINAIKFKQTVTYNNILNTQKFFSNLKMTPKQNIILHELKLSQNPTITVITPSYNQDKYINKCLKSVELQTYQPVEHIVYDPGSTDDSINIIKTYDHVTLINEPDNGQSHAVNKGLLAAKGDIIAWINSDDFYFDENVFEKVAAKFRSSEQIDIIYGNAIYLDSDSNFLRNAYINKDPATLTWKLHQECGISQPAVFFKKSVINKVGLLNENLHYCMDYNYWIKCIKSGLKFSYLNETLAFSHFHIDCKTYGKRHLSYSEVCEMILNEFNYVHYNWIKRYSEFNIENFDGVINNSSNTKVNFKESIETEICNLLKIYNSSHDTATFIENNKDKKGYECTYKEMQNRSITNSTPCYKINTDKSTEPYHTCYTVGPRRFAFNTRWKNKQINKTHEMIDYVNANKISNTCVIAGNGPSLSKIDITLLEKSDLFISNNAFLSPRLLSLAKYYTVVNYLVAEQGYSRINSFNNIIKIVPYWLSYCINEGHNTFFIDAVGYPEFSTNIKKNVSWRHTVSFFNLHLAYGLGYDKVILVGFDHTYNQNLNCKEGDIIQDFNDDTNHFCPEYFKGKKWQAADVKMMESMYMLAKTAFESDNRKIINCSVGGNLEIFPRGILEHEI